MAFRKLFERMTFNLFHSNQKISLLLDKNIFSGKSVLMLGPAATAPRDLEKIDLAEFDVVVRINRAASSLTSSQSSRLGQSCVVFHSFEEQGARSAGVLDPKRLQESNVQIVVFPHGKERNFARVFWYGKRKGFTELGISIKMVHPDSYKKMRMRIQNAKPTSGFVALNELMDSTSSRLHIAGFTFFQTRYMAGYNDQIRTDQDAMAWATAPGAHSPILECADFKRRCAARDFQCEKLTIGEGMAKVLNLQTTYTKF